MDNQNTIPSQLGPVNTIPSVLGPDSVYESRKDRSRTTTNPIWLWALVAIAMLLAVGLFF